MPIFRSKILLKYYYRYSVLPYWNQEHDDALALLEREMARAAAAGDDIMLNEDDDNNNEEPDEDASDMKEDENNSDPISLDYMEGAELADKQKSLIPASRNKNFGEEIIPSNIVYSQPHRIQKNPNELRPGQTDTFENPYRRATQNVIHPSHQNSYATGKVNIN